MSESPKLITCTCPAPAGQVCPVPHDRWLSGGLIVRPISQPYPCACKGGSWKCSPVWCDCAGRVDLENVPATCCAHVNTPLVVARAVHGGDYRTCWCGGHVERHKTQAPVITALPGFIEEDEDDD